MSYIVSQLITSEKTYKFSLLGQSADKKTAAMIAAAAYRAYHTVASEQNVAMITEWLATRGEYSFRKDKNNRLQLAITPLPASESEGANEQSPHLVFTVSEEDDAELLRLSQALFDGHGSAVHRPGCPVSVS